MRWARNVARMGETIHARIILFGNTEQKRKLQITTSTEMIILKWNKNVTLWIGLS
jgi:hypothetical protein